MTESLYPMRDERGLLSVRHAVHETGSPEGEGRLPRRPPSAVTARLVDYRTTALAERQAHMPDPNRDPERGSARIDQLDRRIKLDNGYAVEHDQLA